MRFRFAQLMACFAWLLATGSHWDFLQVYAWGKMVSSYSQTMPLSEAVRLTFTPANMCSVCEVVADAQRAAARERGDHNPASKSSEAGKIPLSLCADGETLVLPADERELAHFTRETLAPPAWHAPVPTPPPRALV
jgi:hypothetical protein